MVKKLTTNLRVPVNTLRKISEFAKKNHGSMNSHIVKAIELYLDQNGRGDIEESVKALRQEMKELQKEMEKVAKKVG